MTGQYDPDDDPVDDPIDDPVDDPELIKPIIDNLGWWSDVHTDEVDWANVLRYGTEPYSDLAPAADSEPTDSTVDSLADLARARMKQDQGFRDKFFTTVRAALIGALVSSVAIMGVYIGSQWHHVAATAIVSFNAAVVVNVLGLALILARNLFPNGSKDRTD